MIALRETLDSPGGRLAALVAEVFGGNGPLVRDLRLDHRPGQELMARATATAFAENRELIVEAGTGVGKSLAYLVPALIHAHLTKRQAVVSTHTISLQEQLQQQDIKLVRRLFRAVPDLAPWADFNTALLVGRANYLCRQRLAQALAQRADLFPGSEGADLARIATWAETTTTGLRQELSPPVDPEVWEWVNADSSACSRRTCNAGNCHYQASRARLKDARLVIVNHSLLFALLGAGAGPGGDMPGILFPQDFVVLDEAHTVPDVATDHLGLAVSSLGVDRLLKRLHNPAKQRGFLRKFGTTHDLRACDEARLAAANFFGVVRGEHLDRRSVVRLRTPDWGPTDVLPPLTALAERLSALVDRLADGAARDEMTDFRDRVRAVTASLRKALTLADDEQVYWLEQAGRRQPIIHVRSAPVDIAPLLRRLLFQRDTGVVLTSATLGPAAGELQPFARSVGAPVENLVVAPSPFDYPRQMRVFVATDAPELSKETRQLDLLWLTDMVYHCAAACPGGTLALFTSHADLIAVADALDGRWQEDGRALLVQGRGASRTELVRRFAAAGNGLLLGTDSFWTGVDVPGPALSQVIVTRLPFDNPSHPVAEAKAERIRAAGRSPFAEMSLPAAVTQFRQGIGRLIRQCTDVGTITILDSRVVRKTYGRYFLSALPVRELHRFTREDREATFRPLFQA